MSWNWEERIRINHFDYIARPIAQSGLYDVVCFGHNHASRSHGWGKRWPSIRDRSWEPSLDRRAVKMLPSSFIVYDTAADEATWVSDRFLVVICGADSDRELPRVNNCN